MEPARRSPGVTDAQGNDTIYMSVIDKDGNIVSLIQSNYSGFGSGLVPPGDRLHAAESRRPVLAREGPAEHARAAQASAAHDHPGVHGEGRPEDRLRHHGRLEPGTGARAVRLEHRRLRHDDPAGARGRALHEGQLRRLRRADRVARAGERPRRAEGARSRRAAGAVRAPARSATARRSCSAPAASISARQSRGTTAPRFRRRRRCSVRRNSPTKTIRRKTQKTQRDDPRKTQRTRATIREDAEDTETQAVGDTDRQRPLQVASSKFRNAARRR